MPSNADFILSQFCTQNKPADVNAPKADAGEFIAVPTLSNIFLSPPKSFSFFVRSEIKDIIFLEEL